MSFLGILLCTVVNDIPIRCFTDTVRLNHVPGSSAWPFVYGFYKRTALFRDGDKTQLEYSSVGRIRVLYSVSLVCAEQSFTCLLSMHIVPVALSTDFLM